MPRRLVSRVDVADHEHVERGKRGPGERQVEAEAEWGRLVVPVIRHDDPEDVLHGYEGKGSRCY